MSNDVSSRGRNLTIIAWVAGGVIILGVLIGMTLNLGGGGKVSPTGPKTGESAEQRDRPLAAARSALEQQTDLNTCRDAIQQLNTHLARGGKGLVPDLNDEAARRLQDQFRLSKDDLDEVAAGSFTTLDAYHLEECLLLRDAARSLDAVGGPATLQQVEAAFAWAVRQVRLDGRGGGEPVPPAFALRRGWGSAVERALVFLTLLEQLGGPDTPAPQGALVVLSHEGRQILWACGVALDARPDALYLFDPRLGLPLPGPGGKGVATLAQARSDPKVLAQLDAGDKPRYDVTAKQAGAARVQLVCTLSALAPRMAVLQDRLLRDPRYNNELLPEPIVVRLAQDPPAALKRLREAAGKDITVGVWQPAAGLLRHFLPKAEGGDDIGRRVRLAALPGYTSSNDPSTPVIARQGIYNLQLVAWQDYPPELRDPERFPLGSSLGQRLRDRFAGPFLALLTLPGAPRDLVLRGRFGKGISDLGEERGKWERGRDLRGAVDNLGSAIKEWANQARSVEASLLRARDDAAARAKADEQYKEVWKPTQPVFALLMAAQADEMGAEVLYQLALARHEQAERLQARQDQTAREPGAKPSPADADRLKGSWTDAHESWVDYTRWKDDGWKRKAPDGAVKRPPDSGDLAVRRLDARALAGQGKTAEAVRLLRDVSGPMSDQEKLAQLYLARTLERKPGEKGK